jgi:hypothetical protein
MSHRVARRVDEGVLIERGVDEARVDLKDVDAEPAPLKAEGFGETRDGKFACGVLSSAWQATTGDDRTHVDKRGPVASSQQGQRCPAHFRKRENVNFKYLAEHRGIVRVKRSSRADTRVVDDQIESIKVHGDTGEELSSLQIVGQIGGDHNDPGRIGPFSDQALCDGLKALGRAAGYYDVCTGTNEAFGQRFAQA